MPQKRKKISLWSSWTVGKKEREKEKKLVHMYAEVDNLLG